MIRDMHSKQWHLYLAYIHIVEFLMLPTGWLMMMLPVEENAAAKRMAKHNAELEMSFSDRVSSPCSLYRYTLHTSGCLLGLLLQRK
jgi:hypothetical protein